MITLVIWKFLFFVTLAVQKFTMLAAQGLQAAKRFDKPDCGLGE